MEFVEEGVSFWSRPGRKKSSGEMDLVAVIPPQPAQRRTISNSSAVLTLIGIFMIAEQSGIVRAPTG